MHDKLILCIFQIFEVVNLLLSKLDTDPHTMPDVTLFSTRRQHFKLSKDQFANEAEKRRPKVIITILHEDLF